MKAETSLAILENFLTEQNIKVDASKILKDHLVESDDLKPLSENIVTQIITDAYDVASEKVKEIDKILVSTHEIHLGRVQKEQIKKCLDYKDPKDIPELINLARDETGNFEKTIRKILESNQLEEHEIGEAVEKFHENLSEAIKKKNSKRVKDYLTFVYSRLIARNEKRNLSLKEIFDSNKNISKYQLTETQQVGLEEFCSSDEQHQREQTIKDYNRKYLDILDDDVKSNEKSSVIYLNITQKLFDTYKTKEQFYDAIFAFIKTAYQKLKNHRTLAVKVSNIVSKDLNIKWEIYSYLSIFAEKFIKEKEKHQYFQPEVLCKNYLKYRHDLEIDLGKLKKYFAGESTYDQLGLNGKIVTKTEVDEIRFVYSGFTFIDCSILLSKTAFENSKEVSFIENKNELLLLFFKHEVDSRKIPCPVCGSLVISGNSFPELGIRSWECKNPLCSQRSKTNRGKRYSARTIFMQDSTFDFRPENTISSTLIAKWRKDVVEDYTIDSLYSMITKYFSQVGDSLTIINAQSSKKFKQVIEKESRTCQTTSFKEFVKGTQDNLHKQFFEKSELTNYLDCFLYNGKTSDTQKSIKLKSGEILHGNCIQELEKIEGVHNMVTSPPYYNAREYTQWLNLYDYLHDMYLVAGRSFQSLQRGGVFFFNIGDIFDNEKITVTSKMGGKRIPLGAYIILLFQKAGFELLDNVIWNKGEPQSNRHKNDGNNVPYYQRPANCYEHIFIFKKPGAKLQLNKNKEQRITTNHQKFTPVFKIFGKDKVNTYGHTAPFPEYVPRMSMLCFTNEDDVVLDPFAGSGTTVFTAIKENRCGVGIELNKEYVKLSKKKIKENT